MIASPKELLRLLVAAVVILAYGCGPDPDAVVVDFSKTMSVDQPRPRLDAERALRVAVAAMISPKETFVYYRQILSYIGNRLGKEVKLIQRKTYGEINELLGRGQIDLAFICSGPYVAGKENYGFELLATPQVQGSHFYQSYLIVNRDSPFRLLEDLRGKTFAFTDPDSHTGKLVPTYWLAQNGESPQTFFGKTIYTHSHDNSVLAVARALVDGAAIDGLIWEYYHHKNPVFTSNTRIIMKSKPFGIPPIVASRDFPQELREPLRDLLFSMHNDPEGQRILKELMIDRFISPREDWYEGIREMSKNLALLEDKSYAPKKP